MTETKPKVLLVDDVHANLVALDAMLEELPCELVRAGNGNEALKQLLRHEFAVMLLDVQMPGIDGFEVARYARGNPSTRDTPIIFLTALDDTEEAVLRGYGSGAVDFLHKPLNAHVLRAKVSVFIQLWSERQQLEREIAAHEKTLSALERANTALRHFTDAASHDLKAPVRSIRGFLHALHEDVGNQLDPQALDYLVRSMKSAERMDSLIDALLAYARLQRTLESERVSVTDLIEQVRGELHDELVRSGGQLETTVLPDVQGDPDRLYQLFLNLVGNALKYRRPGVAPRIRVSAETHGTECSFCVEDNGIGIDPAHRAQIFQAFFRSDAQRQYKGSGLGLAICQQVIEQHNGRLWVESECGQGSRFYFTLPRA